MMSKKDEASQDLGVFNAVMGEFVWPGQCKNTIILFFYFAIPHPSSNHLWPRGHTDTHGSSLSVSRSANLKNISSSMSRKAGENVREKAAVYCASSCHMFRREMGRKKLLLVFCFSRSVWWMLPSPPLVVSRDGLRLFIVIVIVMVVVVARSVVLFGVGIAIPL